MAPLHPLDPARAENAIGPEHQGDYHDHVGREVLGAAAHIGIEVAGGEALDEADDQAAHYGADHGVEAAEDDHGKHLQADQRQVDVDTEHAAPDHGDDRPAEQRPQHDAFEPEAEQDHGRQHGSNGDDDGHALDGKDKRNNEAR